MLADLMDFRLPLGQQSHRRCYQQHDDLVTLQYPELDLPR